MHDTAPQVITSNGGLADAFLDLHYPLDWARNREDGITHINSAEVPQLTCDLVDFIASVVASIIDAGSERDAVNENDDLHRVIEAELKSWTPGATSYQYPEAPS